MSVDNGVCECVCAREYVCMCICVCEKECACLHMSICLSGGMCL